jgi:hydrogenase expression/formation protein HypE
MRATDEGRDSAIIGRAVEQHPEIVFMKTEIGGTRILDLPLHEQLPRIC